MKSKLLAALLFFSYSVSAWSMQALNETDLANATGQDGVNIGLNFNNSTISYSDLSLLDKTGIPAKADYNCTNGTNCAASLSIAPWQYAGNSGIQLKNQNGAAINGDQIVIQMDADANNTKPVFNALISLPQVRQIEFSSFSIYMVAGEGLYATPRTLGQFDEGKRKNSFSEIIAIPGLRISLLDPLKFNIQLGSQPQGHLFKIVGGSINKIESLNAGHPIRIKSRNDAGNVTNGNIDLGLVIQASDQSTNSKGFRLYAHNDNGENFSGVYGDLVNTGLVIGATGTTDKFDIFVNNIQLGTGSPATLDNFNNVKNGSIGNIGIKGIAVTDFKATVRGQ